MKKVKVPQIEPDEVLIVKVGSSDRPATSDDIASVQLALEQVAQDPNCAFVTHHAISFEILPRRLFTKKVVSTKQK